MSAHALTVYESLLASGIDESRARRAAEAIDENIRERVDAAGEKAKAEFVAKDEFNRRMADTPARDEVDGKFDKVLEVMARIESRLDAGMARMDARLGRMDARIDRLDARIDSLYRILVGILIGVIGVFAAAVVAVVKFVLFGL